MEEKDKILKVKKKLIFLFLVYISVAFAMIGSAFLPAFLKEEEEVADFSEIVLSGSKTESQSVKLDLDTLPIYITQTSQKDIQLYYAADMFGRGCLVSMSSSTFDNIVRRLNGETGKLDTIYRIKGVAYPIDEPLKQLVISNSKHLFRYRELGPDNFSEYFGEFYIKEKVTSKGRAGLPAILVVLGVFLLVLAFVYIIPAFIRANRGGFGIFDEKDMLQALEGYLPNGETLAAAVRGVGVQTEIKQTFKKCRCVGDKLVPDENCAALQVKKIKYSKYDVYVGITQHYLILAECKAYKHLYQFNDAPDLGETVIEEIGSCIPIRDIGTRFLLAEIQNCVVKQGWMGAANCSITMKNGSFLKVMLPKRGGLGVPRHPENREAIIARLKGNNK